MPLPSVTTYREIYDWSAPAFAHRIAPVETHLRAGSPCILGRLSLALRHLGGAVGPLRVLPMLFPSAHLRNPPLEFIRLPPSQPKEFWGYSYVTGLVAVGTGMRDDLAMVLVSSSMFVLANYFCCHLWDTTVAAWMMVINYWWIDGAAQGLTEPLFMALLLRSFLALRRERSAIDWTNSMLCDLSGVVDTTTLDPAGRGAMPSEKAQKIRQKIESFVGANISCGNLLQLSTDGRPRWPFAFRRRTHLAGFATH